MNLTLWQEIAAFDLDYPLSSYTFSLRLANENGWTFNFTRDAILEYKKFMYLAATAGAMVAPSEIVDVVWHQHLIYTQSYSAFCKVLGREVHHIPSTRSEAERQQLKNATERTQALYIDAFGQQPAAFWQYGSMMDSLGMPVSNISIFAILAMAVISYLTALPFAVWFLRPLYVQIDNPYFMEDYVFLLLLVVFVLECYNYMRIRKMFYAFPSDAFVYNLSPEEAVYLKTGIEKSVYWWINKMIDKKALRLNKEYVEPGEDIQPTDPVAFAAFEILGKYEFLRCISLINMLRSTTFFANAHSAIDNLKNHLQRSKYFQRLFLTNLVILALASLLGSARWVIGAGREKPVTYISFMVIFFIIYSVFYLVRLTRKPVKRLIRLYNASIQQDERQFDDRWNYFLVGTAALSPVIVPFITQIEDGGSGGDGSGGGCSGGCGGGGGCGGCGS